MKILAKATAIFVPMAAVTVRLKVVLSIKLEIVFSLDESEHFRK